MMSWVSRFRGGAERRRYVPAHRSRRPAAAAALKSLAWALFLSVAALVVASCATGGSTTEGSGDPPEKIRARLAKATDPLERNALLVELSRAELDRARRSHTVFGYRRFLQEFPQGEASTTARALLESLRFEEAEKEDTLQAWTAFLSEHPQGRRTADARRRLAEVEVREALDSDDLATIRRVLTRHPPPDATSTVEEKERWAALVEREDVLSWKASREANLATVEAYLAERPAGRFRNEAMERREQLIEEVLLAEDDLVTARRRIDSGQATPAQKATAAELELRRALRTLDETALRRLVADSRLDGGGEEAKGRAKAMLDSLKRQPLSQAVRKAMAEAARGAGLRTRSELKRLVTRGDPRERAEALVELSEWGNPSDLDLILDFVDARYVVMRLAAIEGVASMADSQERRAWTAIVRGRLEALSSQAHTATGQRRLALLRESIGDLDGALAAWREVTRLDPEDVVAHERVLAFEQSRNDRLAMTAAATTLLKAAIEFGEHRWPRPADPGARFGPEEGELLGLPKELTLLRQLCSAIDLAHVAVQSLAAQSPASVSTTIPAFQAQPGPPSPEHDRALSRMETKKRELEATVKRRAPQYAPCGGEVVPERVQRSRASRAKAMERLGRSGDERLLPVLDNLRWSRSSKVRNAATSALHALRSS